MTFTAFRKLAFARGWSIEVLRCVNSPPSDELLAVMDQLGLEKYERFVTRLQNEADANWQRLAFGAEYR